MTNSGPAGLVNVSLRIGNETVTRSILLAENEKARISFLNLRFASAGELELRVGDLEKRLQIAPSLAGHAADGPYREFHNTTADLHQLGDDSFYIRSDGDYPVLQYADQYGAIYLPGGLPLHATVVVKLEDPELRTNWLGRVGIMVRNDISKPGESPGYVVLDSSPAAGSYLEWSDDEGRSLNKHSEFEGYTTWPHSLKLERRGDEFIGYSSEDGNEWTEIGQAKVRGCNDNLDVGMFAFRDSARFEDWKVVKR